MNDNEKLIAETADAIHEAFLAKGGYRGGAEAALAVFEKAHEKYLDREDAEYGALIEQINALKPEWEYINLIGEAPMQMAIKATAENATHKRTARRVIEPGPWMPVAQEGGSS